MAIRTLLFLICTAVMAPLLAKEAPRTMTTRKVITASAFNDNRAKSLRSMKSMKKKKKKQRAPKSHWGAPNTRRKS